MRIERSSKRSNWREMRKGRKTRQEVCNVCRNYPEIQTVEMNNCREVCTMRMYMYGKVIQCLCLISRHAQKDLVLERFWLALL